jgi:hypothetical protein
VSIFKRKKQEPGEVVTAVSFEARLTTYTVDGKWMSERVLRGIIPEAEMPPALLELIRQRTPREG